MGIDEATAAIARRQHSLITLDQLRTLGLCVDAVDYRVRLGRLERLEPRLFRIAGAVETWEQRVLGACLSVGAPAVACRRTAAVLWDLLRLQDAPIELAVPRPRNPKWVDARVFRSTDIIAAHRTIHKGIPTTSVARTLVDLGAVVPAQFVDDAVDRALVEEMATPAELTAILDNVARQGRRGVGALRSALADFPEGVETLLEAKLVRLINRSTLPPPTLQHWVSIGGRPRYRIDVAYPEAMIAIEGDGREAHGRRQPFEDDRARQNVLEIMGWRFLRFTFRQVTLRGEWVIAQIRDMYRACLPAARRS